MDVSGLLALAMFVSVCAVLLAGYRVAFTLGGVALLFAILGIAIGAFEPAYLRAFPLRIIGAMENQILFAVPLFILMGVVLERSRIAEDLLETASALLVRVRGGLAYAVVLVGALLAASTGIVGATVVTMALIALPTMLRQGYSPALSTGTIAASGTLGQIIPPSIVLILLADVLSNANQVARQEAGLPPSAISVGDLFSGALLPGLMLVGIYLLYIFLTTWLKPSSCPAPVRGPTAEEDRVAPGKALFALGAPLTLILAVLGSIIFGIASPTEAAAIGAVGAILLAGIRLEYKLTGRMTSRLLLSAGSLIALAALLALNVFFDMRANQAETGTLDGLARMAAMLLSVIAILGIPFGGLATLRKSGQLRTVLRSAAEVTTMVFVILIGAALFSIVFRGFGGDDYVEHFLTLIPGGVWGSLALVMGVMFVLGFFLDFIEITFVVVPLVAPPLIMMGVDPLWLGVLMAMNLQTSFLTPPFGFALFYLRGAAPASISTGQIWRGAVPFVGLQICAILLVVAIPGLATWLPSLTRS